MKRLTLEEIGRMAGVSRSTVSRVINQQPDVSPAVKERVLEVIQSTGYRPNLAARSLVSNRSDVLGLIIPSTVQNLFNDPYFGRLIQGITRASNAAGQTLSLFLFEDEREEFEIYRRAIANGLVDGVILTATRMGNPLVDRLRNDGLTFVMVGRPDADEIPYVDVENRAGARSATEHLIQHGRRRIATVAAPSNTTPGLDRRSGFLDAMQSATMEVPSTRVSEGDFTSQGGYEAMTRLLEHRPDAVFCASDTMALGALRAIADAGLKCPDDIALAGFDGLVGADDVTPSLTTVRQPVQSTGEAAVSLLLDLLRSSDADRTPRLLPTELVVRRSCGCSGEEDAA